METFGEFLASCVFSEPHAAGFRPASQICTKAMHTMCGSMADIQSAAAEIRRGKKEERRTNYSMKIYMVCPIP